jgi:hypothetical protein
VDNQRETRGSVVRSRKPVAQLALLDLLELPEHANSGSSQAKFPQFSFSPVIWFFHALILTL